MIDGRSSSSIYGKPIRLKCPLPTRNEIRNGERSEKSLSDYASWELRSVGADDRQICAFDRFARRGDGGGREREKLKRVKIIYEVADIAKGTEEYRFSSHVFRRFGTWRLGAVQGSTRFEKVSLVHRGRYLARVCVQNRVHASIDPSRWWRSSTDPDPPPPFARGS